MKTSGWSSKWYPQKQRTLKVMIITVGIISLHLLVRWLKKSKHSLLNGGLIVIYHGTISFSPTFHPSPMSISRLKPPITPHRLFVPSTISWRVPVGKREGHQVAEKNHGKIPPSEFSGRIASTMRGFFYGDYVSLPECSFKEKKSFQQFGRLKVLLTLQKSESLTLQPVWDKKTGASSTTLKRGVFRLLRIKRQTRISSGTSSMSVFFFSRAL